MLIPLAIALGVLASVCFALGATGQHLGIERNFSDEGTESRSMTFQRLLKLLVTPLWVGGLALIGTGAAMHIVALNMAPLTVVQPLGILAVPFSILLANRIYKTRTSPGLWGFVALTVAGIVGFTLLSAMTAAEHERPTTRMVMIAAAIVVAIAVVFALIGHMGPRWATSLAWAWAGAVLYGLGSGFIKLITIEWGVWDSGLLWASVGLLLLVYSAGGWMIQQAYATGPAEVVVGVMTTVDPVVAVAFGLIVLDEGRNITPPIALGMVLAALASATGVALLSKFHPDAKRHDAERATVVEG